MSKEWSIVPVRQELNGDSTHDCQCRASVSDAVADARGSTSLPYSMLEAKYSFSPT